MPRHVLFSAAFEYTYILFAPAGHILKAIDFTMGEVFVAHGLCCTSLGHNYVESLRHPATKAGQGASLMYSESALEVLAIGLSKSTENVL